MVDFRIHYVKANGSTSAKVFKLRPLDLLPVETLGVDKRISVADMSTRRHYIGRHEVDAVLNGHVERLGSFELRSQA
jgi:hypothetical protein